MPAPRASLAGFRRVQLTWGQTLQDLAAQELGDAALWPRIAAINGLKPPWVTGDPSLASPSVRLYGDTVIIPDPTADIEPGRTSAEDVFKADVALPKGLLDVVDGDFALLAGRLNLRQALEHRVRVGLGELTFHQQYGCAVGTLKGQRNEQVTALVGGKYVERAVRLDARIADVTRVVVSPEGDRLPIEVEAETVTGHPLNMTTTA